MLLYTVISVLSDEDTFKMNNHNKSILMEFPSSH